MTSPQTPTEDEDVDEVVERLNRVWYEETGREPLTPKPEQERAA